MHLAVYVYQWSIPFIAFLTFRYIFLMSYVAERPLWPVQSPRHVLTLYEDVPESSSMKLNNFMLLKLV